MSWKGDMLKAGISSDGKDIDIFDGKLTVDDGLVVDTGGVTVTTGGLTVAAGNLSMTTGNITAITGDIVASAGKIQASNIYTAKVSLTNVNIKALRATPKVIVAAPGTGKIIEFVGAILKLNAGANVLTESADNLVLMYGGAAVCSETIECTDFIDQAADTIIYAVPLKDAVDATADATNVNLELFNSGDGEFGGNAAADATLDVFVTYRVHDLS